MHTFLDCPNRFIQKLQKIYLFCIFCNCFILQLLILTFYSCSTRSDEHFDILAATTGRVYTKNENNNIKPKN
jgi:hypothetical protein